MKQGTSAVTSGSLPVSTNRRRSQGSSVGSARGQSTTSTTGLRQAGAKKCVTVARSGWAISLKMRWAGSELVLEVMTAVAVTRASTSAKMRRLSARSSVAASITQSQPRSTS
jgi:hypothetical protein